MTVQRQPQYIKLKRELKAWLYLAPALILFGTFVFYPFIKTIWLSFSITTPAGKFIRFAGLRNYRTMFASSDFINTLAATAKFAVIVMAGSCIAGLFLAIIANQTIRGMRLYRTVFSMPMAVASSCISIAFSYILSPNNGFLNGLLGTNINWLNTTGWALFWVSFVTIWLNSSLNYIILIAAMQAIDQSLYESAELDGANFIQKQWHVTLPGISPTLFFTLVINVILAFQSFAQIQVMTSGGPFRSTSVINYDIYLNAFKNSRFGVAYAESIILFLMILIITLVEFRFEKKVTYQ